LGSRALIIKDYRQPFDRVWASAQEAVGQSGASLQEADKPSGRIKASMGLSLLSWGEVIDLTITAKGNNETRISGLSKSTFGLTLVDWGKNQKNLSTLYGYIDWNLAQRGPQPTRPITPAVAAELEKLASLKTKGILTEAEFDARKQRLLG
jgi:hypothetical protein